MLLYLILTFSTSNIIETHSLIHFHKRELQLRISSGTRIAPRIGRVLLLYLRLLYPTTPHDKQQRLNQSDLSQSPQRSSSCPCVRAASSMLATWQGIIERKDHPIQFFAFLQLRVASLKYLL